ncbi:MAG: hypothetical protein IPL88_12135 [Rhizobiales bacterium]|nr:hypothetical protein [Hyphomicrobiales bacterium]
MRGFAAIALALAFASPAGARAQSYGQPYGDVNAPPQPGFTHCAAPRAPSCVRADATYADDAAAQRCKAELDRHGELVFLYRACLMREITRAVLEVNVLGYLYRCKSGDKRACEDHREAVSEQKKRPAPERP